jgi:hypothetical protein
MPRLRRYSLSSRETENPIFVNLQILLVRLIRAKIHLFLDAFELQKV